MIHRIQINGYDDRREMVAILAEHGHMTWIEKDNKGPRNTERYFVCVIIKDSKEAINE